MTTEEKLIEKRGQRAVLEQEIDLLETQLWKEEREERKREQAWRSSQRSIDDLTARQRHYHSR